MRRIRLHLHVLFFFAYTRNLRFFLLRQRRDKSDLYHTVFSRVSDFFFLETIPIHFFDSKQVHSYSCIAVTGRERLVILSVEMLACKKHTSTRTTFTSTPRLETNQNRLTSKASIPNFVTRLIPQRQRPPGIRIVISSWHLFWIRRQQFPWPPRVACAGSRSMSAGRAGPRKWFSSSVPFRSVRLASSSSSFDVFLSFSPPAGRPAIAAESKRKPSEGKVPLC